MMGFPEAARWYGLRLRFRVWGSVFLTVLTLKAYHYVSKRKACTPSLTALTGRGTRSARRCQGTCWYTGNLVIPLAGQGPESFARCPRPVLPCRSWPSAHGKTVSVGASEFPESRTLCRFRRRRRPLNCCCCESRGRQLHWPTGAASQGRVGKEFSERVSDFTEGYTGLVG